VSEKSQRWLYVVEAQPGPVKVGIAKDVWRRFDFLQTACFVPLELKFAAECAPADATLVESEAHKILSASRIIGEWFSVSCEMAIQTIKDAAKSLNCELAITPVSTSKEWPVMLRIQPELLADIDNWRARQRPIPSRAGAILKLAAISLLVENSLDPVLKGLKAAKRGK
jgi:hypothetical protein